MTTAETVMVGCRLPHGLFLEVGYTTVREVDRKRITSYVKTERYQRFELKGTNEHTRGARAQGIQVPSTGNPEPFINANVPKDLWDEWMKKNAKSWFITSGNIFVVASKDAASAKAMSIDSMSTQAPLAPMNPTGDPRAPKRTDKHDGVATANFKD